MRQLQADHFTINFDICWLKVVEVYARFNDGLRVSQKISLIDFDETQQFLVAGSKNGFIDGKLRGCKF